MEINAHIKLQEHFEKPILRVKKLGDGTHLVTFADDEKSVIKTNESRDIKAKMLIFLKEYLPCVDIIKQRDEFVALEYVENNSCLNEIEVARIIANLHSNSSDKFGFEYDTEIASLTQKNTQTNSWIEFFKNERIFYMSKKAFDENRIPLETLNKIDKFLNKLENFLPEPKPALLHGNIWSGNILSNGNDIKFIDPSIYYGHNEAELAFIKLFNTFSNKFFDEYSSISKIDKEFFEYRANIYNLYPLLVHIRIFGRSYLKEFEAILNKFI